ncbi:MAG: hypothetical protein WAV15_03195 [Minisyncoccia bacterium]
MKYPNLEKLGDKNMNAEDVASILSQTLKDVAARKITLRYALVVSRLALALSKTIETVELKKRVEFIEQVLKKRK